MANEEIKRVITITAPDAAQTISGLRQEIKEYNAAIKDMDIQSEEFRDTTQKLTSSQTLLRQALRGVTAAEANSYNALQAQLTLLQKRRKEIDFTTDEYKQLTEEAGKLQQQLKDMDAEAGVFGRNVGNYGSAFDGFSEKITEVTKDLPSLVEGANAFGAATGVNVPKIFASVQALNALVKVQGGVVNGAKAMTAVIGAWGVALLAIAAAGSAVVANWERLKTLWSDTSPQAKAKRALKEMREELVATANEASAENIVRLKELRQQYVGLGDDLEAKKKFVEEYAEELHNMGVELNNVNDADKIFYDFTDKYISAMIARAKATAIREQAAKKYAEYLGKIDENEQKIAGAQAARDRMMASLTATDGQGGRNISTTGTAPGSGNTTSIQGNIARENKVIEKLREERKALDADIEALLTEMFTMAGKLDAEAAKWLSSGSSGSSSSGSSSGKTAQEIVREMVAKAQEKWLKENRAKSTNKIESSATFEEAVNSQYISAMHSAIDFESEIASLRAENNAQWLSSEDALSSELERIELERLGKHEAFMRDMLDGDALSIEERIAMEEELTRNIEQQEAVRTKAQKRAQKNNQQLIEATSDMLSVAGDIFQEESIARKGFATGQAIIDTYLAANKALTELPTPANFVAMAATITTGLLNVKSILSTAVDGSNAEAMMHAPNVAQQLPATYTRQLVGDNELTELNKSRKVYVVESDITEAQEAARVKVESASF